MLDLTKRGRILNVCHLLEELIQKDKQYDDFARPLLELSKQFKLEELETTLIHYQQMV